MVSIIPVSVNATANKEDRLESTVIIKTEVPLAARFSCVRQGSVFLFEAIDLASI
jgi:hypothetical protein